MKTEELLRMQRAAAFNLGYACGRLERLGGYKVQGTHTFTAEQDPELTRIFLDGIERGYQEQEALDVTPRNA